MGGKLFSPLRDDPGGAVIGDGMGGRLLGPLLPSVLAGAIGIEGKPRAPLLPSVFAGTAGMFAPVCPVLAFGIPCGAGALGSFLFFGADDSSICCAAASIMASISLRTSLATRLAPNRG